MNNSAVVDAVSQAAADTNLQVCAKNHILVVDDEDMVRKIFKQLLGIYLPECRIDGARNGREALEKFERRHHSVVLMDLFMPVMDGETAFNRLRALCGGKNWQMPAVVFCTGYEPPHGIRDAISADPAHCLLRKPVTNARLVETIRLRLNRPA